MSFNVARLDPRARFVLLLVPRLLLRRSTPMRLAGYAFELQERGNRRLGDWCWRRAISTASHLDEHTCRTLIKLCVGAGRYDAAEQLVAAYFAQSGVIPGIGFELVGQLAARGRFAAARRVFDDVLKHAGQVVADLRWPSPAWSSPPSPAAIGTELAQHGRLDDARRSELQIELAKLSFSFEAFDACAELFSRAQQRARLGPEERIAHLHATSKSAAVGSLPRPIEELPSANDIGDIDADWLILLAAVMASAGAGEAAASAVEHAVRRAFADHPEREAIADDCRAMLLTIAQMRTPSFDRHSTAPGGAPQRAAAPKLFVCGIGWSGSGALYDALLEFEGLHAMPLTPIDQFVNACTDDEMTFVQGPGGLGWIWRNARDDGRVEQSELLELLRFHVIGGGAFGHSEHKCAKNARHLLATFGSRYSSVFRRMIEAVARLPANAPVTELRNILAETTEALTTLLGRCGESDCAVFNNAVFGQNVDMLEIFDNFKAAVVVRDPLDQYADRRAQDIKHWMTPDRFVHFYREVRLGSARGRAKLAAAKAGDTREIEFERFVRDDAYRRETLDWLLEGVRVERTHRRFDPQISVKNIGIHRRLLTDDERAVLEKRLAGWRRS